MWVAYMLLLMIKKILKNIAKYGRNMILPGCGEEHLEHRALLIICLRYLKLTREKLVYQVIPGMANNRLLLPHLTSAFLRLYPAAGVQGRKFLGGTIVSSMM